MTYGISWDFMGRNGKFERFVNRSYFVLFKRGLIRRVGRIFNTLEK
jgi:hypothetical protein